MLDNFPGPTSKAPKLTIEEEIAALEKKQNQIQARISKKKEKLQANQRKNLRRVQGLLGVASIKNMETEKDPAKAATLRSEMMALLNRFYKDADNKDRKFLIEQGWIG